MSFHDTTIPQIVKPHRGDHLLSELLEAISKLTVNGTPLRYMDTHLARTVELAEEHLNNNLSPARILCDQVAHPRLRKELLSIKRV